jgi:hypothetical protein
MGRELDRSPAQQPREREEGNEPLQKIRLRYEIVRLMPIAS